MRSFLLYLNGLMLLLAIGGLILAPVAAPRIPQASFLPVAAENIFASFCHQDPGRSFHLAGAVLPVCCRCTGIYFGALVGWFFWYFVPRRRRDRAVSNALLFFGLGPMVGDGFLNAVGLWYSPALLRLTTGLLFGAVTARTLWPPLRELVESVNLRWQQTADLWRKELKLAGGEEVCLPCGDSVPRQENL